MAHDRQEVIVGGRITAGSVEVDSTKVTGEGGPESPHLVVPITVKMRQHQPGEGQIAMVGLRAWLSSQQQGVPSLTLAAPIDEWFDNNMPFVSPRYEQTNGMPTILRFRLTPAELVALENRRHTEQARPNLQLFVGMQPQVAGLNHVGEGDDRPWGETGLASFRAYFWNVSARSLSLEISQQTWVEKVLPGLGYDRYRLLELKFPIGLPDHSSAAQEFDRARRALDDGRYRECVVACREIINMWNKQLQANQSNQMGDVIGVARQWGEEDNRRQLVTKLWTALLEIANVAHHTANEPSAQPFSLGDARMLFYQVAIMSEYLAGTG